MSEVQIPADRLIARIKERMQQARQLCPFFQLEQQAAESPSPAALPLPLGLLPEIAVAGLDGVPLSLNVDQQLALCAGLACLVNVESSFCGGDADLLGRIRRADPERYLIARDFVVDEYQILQARLAGANALTLSNALLGPRRTQLYHGKLRFWEMEPVLEVHSPDDIRLAQDLKSRIVAFTPPPGGGPGWEPAALAEAAASLGDARLLICAGDDPALLSGLPASVKSALAPGLALWQSPDPGARLAALRAALSTEA